MSRPAGDERRQLQWYVSASHVPARVWRQRVCRLTEPRTAADVVFASAASADGTAVAEYRLTYHPDDMDPIARPTLGSGVLTGGQK